jgi:RNA polymerase sigma factor (sigma-70 family)
LASGNGVVSKGARFRRLVVADERLVARLRSGDSRAFEALYKRHCAELLSFCAYVLGSRHDAEDAVQATFSAAYRALLSHERPVALRPWLFTIARNDCLSILRKRRPEVELNGEPALRGDPYRELEVREEVRHTLRGLLELPEAQRVALVLAEMHGLSQSEIGSVLGVRADQVKAYIYQARSHLISDRRAREADCCEIREELASARGAALLRGRLRRHLRACAGCRTYADGVARQRHQFGCLVPLTPPLLLKYRALENILASGRSAAPAVRAGGAAAGGSLAAAVEMAGGGGSGIALKLAAGIACLGASACVGAGVLATSGESPSHPSTPVLVAKLPSRLGGDVTASAAGSATQQAEAPGQARTRRRVPRAGGGQSEEQLPPLGSPAQASQPGVYTVAEPEAEYPSAGSEVLAAPAGQPRPSRDEHLREREENQRQSAEQHARKTEERTRKSEAARSAAGAQKGALQQRARERGAEREERQREREAREATKKSPEHRRTEPERERKHHRRAR